MCPFGLPKLPGIGESPFAVAGRTVKGGIDGVKQLADDIDSSLGTLDRELERVTKPLNPEKTANPQDTGVDYVSDESTLRFQLDLLIDNATDLETIHLPNKGRINGNPCDCIAKHARILRAHAKETIPIAARQGKDSRVFDELASLASHLMEIGTKEMVMSGEHDEEYLQQAGLVSSYRKQLETVLGQTRTTFKEHCKDCPTTLSLKEFVKQKQARDPGEAQGAT